MTNQPALRKARGSAYGAATRSLLAVLAAVVGIAGSPVAAQASGFCEGSAHNYLAHLTAPLSGRFRRAGDLPFGPSGLKAKSKSRSPISTAGTAAGYLVSYGHGRPPKSLNWTVTWTLHPSAPSRCRREDLGPSAEKKVTRAASGAIARVNGFVSGRPGFYRSLLTIQNRAGRVLGRFGEYLRILRPTFNAAVVLDSTTVSPGGSIRACLVNSGTTTLSYGEEFWIEQFDGSAWKAAPLPDPPLSFEPIGLSSGPGEQVSRWELTIPTSVDPGLYRFRLEVEPIDAAPSSENSQASSKSVPLIAEFHIQ